MMHDTPRYGEPYHPTGCRCADCTPPSPADRAADLAPVDKVAMVATAGFAVGLVLAWLFDLAVGGPGIGVMFQ
jgi:hypothetical protein